MDERAAIARMRRGHAAAAAESKRIAAAEGPRPEQAVAEALAALSVLEELRLWPGPRDTLSELEVEKVRRRWTTIQKRARAEADARAARR